MSGCITHILCGVDGAPAACIAAERAAGLSVVLGARLALTVSHRLYVRRGFSRCEAFGDHVPSSENRFLAKRLVRLSPSSMQSRRGLNLDPVGGGFPARPTQIIHAQVVHLGKTVLRTVFRSFG